MIDRIREHLDIIRKAAENKTIVVFKGFPYSSIKGIKNKYFKDINKMIVNNIDINEFEKEILEATFEAMSEDNVVYWMTYEELIVSYKIVSINFDIKILDNNIFNKRYPYDDTIDNIKCVYENYFSNVEEEIESDMLDEYRSITKFYGDISYSKERDQYYIVYSELSGKDIEYINLYEVEEKNYKVKIEKDPKFSKGTESIELSEDESIFLDLIMNLLSNENLPNEIYIVTMVKLSDLPNMYRERTEILQKKFKGKIKFSFIMKTMESSEIDNLEEYEDLLKRYWNYDSFRELEMYTDVRNRNREIIKISQAQIINDIVEQTSLALQGKSYRDVFITSPTGSGKSVMFQLPALYIREKFKEINPLTIVISPLIALMNDQVDSLKKNSIDIGRTINSNTLPFEREKILEEVENGECSILYLSPETLQSRSDIKTLIGSRNLGLVIIDEAHIVTTWGKTFRADYWYLGIYLQNLRKQYRFPIVTFTATAIYGGPEDMYLETRDSLNMINPISYFGKVRRNDIYMMVSSTDGEEAFEKNSRDYKKTKQQLALDHLIMSNQNNSKSLIYFPTIRSLNTFSSFIRLNDKEIYEKTGHYYGTLEKEEKDEVLSGFKSGDIQFVLATKAFGMGVDIPDIKYVYHYAPTGSVTDYIQEIGRVARDKELVDIGVARCDFLSRDFNDVKKLYGMSRIKKNQLLQVMDKIVQLYKEKGHSRNLLVRAEDFKYIFMDNKDDMEGLDNKIKTALLLIEKDFASPNNIGFPPFVARPRSIYGNEMILVKNRFEEKLLNSPLNQYIEKTHKLNNSMYDSVYSVNLSKLWEENYKEFTFPNFKRILFTPEEHYKLKHKNLVSDFLYSTGISIVRMNENEINDAINLFNQYIGSFSEFSAEKKRLDKFFTVSELGVYLSKSMKIKDKFKARSIAQALINGCFEYQKIKGYKFITERPTMEDVKYKYQNSYDVFIDFAKVTFTQYFKDKKNYYENGEEFIKFYLRNKTSQFNQDVIVLGLAESIGLVHYNVENGNSPQIYLRINSVYPMEQAIKKGDFYSNNLLSDIYLRHRISVEMLTYLFKYKIDAKNPEEYILKYTDFFWSTIEDYFLGKIPIEVEENIYKKRS